MVRTDQSYISTGYSQVCLPYSRFRRRELRDKAFFSTKARLDASVSRGELKIPKMPNSRISRGEFRPSRRRVRQRNISKGKPRLLGFSYPNVSFCTRCTTFPMERRNRGDSIRHVCELPCSGGILRTYGLVWKTGDHRKQNKQSKLTHAGEDCFE
jgi:hypothetical protein